MTNSCVSPAGRQRCGWGSVPRLSSAGQRFLQAFELFLGMLNFRWILRIFHYESYQD